MVWIPAIYLVAGFILDLAFGDPRWLPHPVWFIGKFTTFLDKVLRKVFGPSASGLRVAGIVLVIAVVGLTYASVELLLQVAEWIHPWCLHVISVLLVYTVLATRSLDRETRQVYRGLMCGDLPGARRVLANVVGRDTERLDEQQVARAAVETIAENTVDAVISPLLYLALGGPSLGMTFKAISTLDSMVGYKNEKYLYLGWASARLDDLANWVPARLAGWVLIPLAALLLGKDFALSLRTVARDARKHESPNSAYGEAAMAGALGVSLGGSCYYQGRLVEHPVIGPGIRPLEPRNIGDAISLMYCTAVLGLGLAVLVTII